MITAENAPISHSQAISAAQLERFSTDELYTSGAITLGGVAIVDSLRAKTDKPQALATPTPHELYIGYKVEAEPNIFLASDQLALDALLNRNKDSSNATRREIRHTERQLERESRPVRRLMRALGKACSKLHF